MAQYFGSVISGLFNIYKEINPATLTGAIDVIAVEQANGEILCSPFHVRFGKIGVIRSREKVVDIEVNGEIVPLQMKLGDSGEAYFVCNVSPGDEVPADLATSPIFNSGSLKAMAAGIQALKDRDRAEQNGTAFRSLSEGEEEPEEKMPGLVRHLLLRNSTSNPELCVTKEQQDSPSPRFQLERFDTVPDDLTGLQGQDSFEAPETEAGCYLSIDDGPKDIYYDSCDDVEKSARVNSADQQRKKRLKHRKKSSLTPHESGGHNSQEDEAEDFLAPPRTKSFSSASSSHMNRTMSWHGTSSAHMNGFAGCSKTRASDPQEIGKTNLPATPNNTPQTRSYFETKTELAAVLGGKDSPLKFIKEMKEAEAAQSHVVGMNDTGATDDSIFAMDLSDNENEEKTAREISTENVGGEVADSDEKITDESSEISRSTEIPEGSNPTKGDPPANGSVEAGWGISSILPFMRRSSRKQGSLTQGQGIYLDDLLTKEQIDPTMAALYIPKRKNGSPNSKQRSISVGFPPEQTNGGLRPKMSVADAAEFSTINEQPQPQQGDEIALLSTETWQPIPQKIGDRRPSSHASSPRDDLGYNSSKPSSLSDEDEMKARGPWGLDDEKASVVATGILGEISLSLCGCEGGITAGKFREKLVTYEQFCLDSEKILADPNLVVMAKGKYYPWPVASAMIISAVAYQQELSDDVINQLMAKHGNKFTAIELVAQNAPGTAAQIVDASTEVAKQPTIIRSSAAPSSGYFSWWRRAASVEPTSAASKDEADGSKLSVATSALTVTAAAGLSQSSTTLAPQAFPPISPTPSLPVDISNAKQSLLNGAAGSPPPILSISPASSTGGGGVDSDAEDTTPRFKKTLRLTTEQLKCLNLKPGANEIKFSVTTKFQGTSWCSCHLYLWKYSDTIVISDIDGTITKSDVLGHILPMMGGQWAQAGVAQLFTRIVDNGFRMLYLSARAIGQKDTTKSYLQSIRQDRLSLPEGPLLLSPTSLMAALHREVIEKKPEEFKISALNDIKALFPRNPFWAGLGNKINDVFAYRAVGVPASRIFIINPSGEVRHELTKGFQTTYTHMSVDYVDYLFPPLPAEPKFNIRAQSPPPHTPTFKQTPGPGFMIPENDAAALTDSFSGFSFWRPAENVAQIDESRFQPPPDPKLERAKSKKPKVLPPPKKSASTSAVIP